MNTLWSDVAMTCRGDLFVRRDRSMRTCRRSTLRIHTRGYLSYVKGDGRDILPEHVKEICFKKKQRIHIERTRCRNM